MTDHDVAFIEAARAALEERQQAIVQRNREKIVELVDEIAIRKGDSIDITTAEQTDSTDLKLQDRLKDMLREIDHALNKIEAGEYGDCEGCGDEITRPRLRAQPTARLCVECQEEMEEDKRRRYKRPGLMDEFQPD